MDLKSQLWTPPSLTAQTLFTRRLLLLAPSLARSRLVCRPLPPPRPWGSSQNLALDSTDLPPNEVNWYFFDRAPSSRLCAGVSPAAEGRGRSPAARCGLLVAERLLLQGTGSGRVGLRCCTTRLRRAVRSPRESDFSDWGTRRSCRMARETFPDQGLNPCALHWHPFSGERSYVKLSS